MSVYILQSWVEDGGLSGTLLVWRLSSSLLFLWPCSKPWVSLQESEHSGMSSGGDSCLCLQPWGHSLAPKEGLSQVPLSTGHLVYLYTQKPVYAGNGPVQELINECKRGTSWDLAQWDALVASEGGCLLHAHCKGPEEIKLRVLRKV